MKNNLIVLMLSLLCIGFEFLLINTSLLFILPAIAVVIFLCFYIRANYNLNQRMLLCT